MEQQPHSSVSLTAVRLQTNTNGERPKLKAAVKAAAAECRRLA